MMGHVYFIQIGTDGPIKVGFTKAKKPADRMEELQCGCPWLLRLLGAIPGRKFNEGSLHQKFDQFKMRGEWFRPEIATEVDQILSGEFSWPEVDLAPIDRAILLAGGCQCDLDRATGVSQPQISIARRTGKLPKRIQEYLTSQEAGLA